MSAFIGIFLLVVVIGLVWRDFKIPSVQKVVYLVCAITISAIANFYYVNGISFEPNLHGWEKYAIVLNNSASPAILIMTVFLIYRTWRTSERELKLLNKQNTELLRQNQRALKISELQATENIKRLNFEEQIEIYRGIKPLIEDSIGLLNKASNDFVLCRTFNIPDYNSNTNKICFTDFKNKRIEFSEIKDFLLRSNLTGEELEKYNFNSKSYFIIDNEQLKSLKSYVFKRIDRKDPIKSFNTIMDEPELIEGISDYSKSENAKEFLGNLASDFYLNKKLSLNKNSKNDTMQVSVEFEGKEISDYFNHIEYIATMMNMLKDGSLQKLILSEMIYTKVGRFVLYLFLENRSKYVDGGHVQSDYETVRFTEILKIIAIKEFPEMTEHFFSSIQTENKVPRLINKTAVELRKVYERPIYEPKEKEYD